MIRMSHLRGQLYHIIALLSITIIAIFIATINPEVGPQMNIKRLDLRLEIADTQERRNQGLSNRVSLDENAGMLFVFDQLGQPGFWMKDMHFPLDFIWMNEEYEIVDIDGYVRPESYPELFRPVSAVKYVLEVNAGYVERKKIKIGDTLELALDQ